jgi:DNA-binding transcriptional ArsR family regulator
VTTLSSDEDGKRVICKVDRAVTYLKLAEFNYLHLTYILIWEYNTFMARSATTTDVFNAVGESQRRDILDLLAGGERSVNELVDLLKTKQPQVSKHLKVLKEVGLVSVRGVGQQRLYKLNPEAIKPVHDWVKPFERLWNERLDRLDEYLTELQKGEAKNAKEKPKR